MQKGAGDTWTKVIDIKDFPDLGGEPELLETTTLTDPMQTNILGIQSMDTMQFTCNYDPTDYQTLKDMEGEQIDFAVWFGGETASGEARPTPDGSDGKFEFTGELVVFVVGKGVNEVREMTVSLACSTPITFKAS